MKKLVDINVALTQTTHTIYKNTSEINRYKFKHIYMCVYDINTMPHERVAQSVRDTTNQKNHMEHMTNFKIELGNKREFLIVALKLKKTNI